MGEPVFLLRSLLAFDLANDTPVIYMKSGSADMLSYIYLALWHFFILPCLFFLLHRSSFSQYMKAVGSSIPMFF